MLKTKMTQSPTGAQDGGAGVTLRFEDWKPAQGIQEPG